MFVYLVVLIFFFVIFFVIILFAFLTPKILTWVNTIYEYVVKQQ